MRIILSTLLAGHMNALGRSLSARGILIKFISSYPKWKLKRDRIDPGLIVTSPWFITPQMALVRWGKLTLAIDFILKHLAYANHERFARGQIEACDIFHGLSCHNYTAGKRAKEMGAKYICDHGSSHIQYHNNILLEESNLTGFKHNNYFDSRTVERMVREYDEADQIFVASSFSKRTFISNGIKASKISVIPYGVDLSRYYPTGTKHDDVFRVVYLGALSLRKGIHYLAQGFSMANIKNSELILIGREFPETEILLSGVKNVTKTCLLPISMVRDWFSKSTVFVLPSIEDGFGLVMLEAQACGLPVIATENTGARECIQEGINGFVIPIRDPYTLSERLKELKNNPQKLAEMKKQAILRTQKVGGWDDYAGSVIEEYKKLLK